LLLFSDLNILQSSVVMPLRCSRIFENDFIANLLMNLSVQEFWTSVTFGKVTDKSLVSLFFFTGVVLQWT